MTRNSYTNDSKHVLLQKTFLKYRDDKRPSQLQKILDALFRMESVTTQDLRHLLDVMHPAGRINDLRRQGWNIISTWDICETSPGMTHRMARYSFLNKTKDSEAELSGREIKRIRYIAIKPE